MSSFDPPPYTTPLVNLVLLFSVNFHLEINNPEECTALENEFAEEIRKRGEDFKYYKDQVGGKPRV